MRKIPAKSSIGRILVHQITSGTAGWLTYEQMRRGTDNINENSLAKPIEDIAKGQGFEVQTEFPLREGKRGRPPSIDFMLVNHQKKVVVAFETKYKKTGLAMAGSLSADAARLDKLSLLRINRQIDDQIRKREHGTIKRKVDNYELVRAVMVVWHTTAIMEQIRIESSEILRSFTNMLKAMLPEGISYDAENRSKAMLGVIATKPVAQKQGSLRSGSTVSHRRFWVASFLHQASWKNIR